MFHLRSICGRIARRSRWGLTLLELVVVMAILVVIAGVLVPLLPNLLANANNATGAVNVTELNKAVQAYQAVNYQYPDGYDSLVLAAGTLAPQVLFSTWGNVGTSLPIVSTPTTAEVTSLNHAGITTVYNMVDRSSTGNPSASATFPGVVGNTTMGTFTPTPVTISTSTPLVTATPTYVQQVFGQGAVPANDTTGVYVVLGIGAV